MADSEKMARVFVNLHPDLPEAVRGLVMSYLDHAFAVADMTPQDRTLAALALAGCELAAVPDEAVRAEFLSCAPAFLAGVVKANRKKGQPIRGDLARSELAASGAVN